MIGIIVVPTSGEIIVVIVVMVDVLRVHFDGPIRRLLLIVIFSFLAILFLLLFLLILILIIVVIVVLVPIVCRLSS